MISGFKGVATLHCYLEEADDLLLFGVELCGLMEGDAIELNSVAADLL